MNNSEENIQALLNDFFNQLIFFSEEININKEFIILNSIIEFFFNLSSQNYNFGNSKTI